MYSKVLNETNLSLIFNLFESVRLSKKVDDKFLYKNARTIYIETYQIMRIFFIGIVGESENKGESLYMWTHKKFEIGYNDKRVRG